jgi:hypothetical protein
MRRTIGAALGVAVMLCMCEVAFGQAVMISFDQDTAGNAIAAGTVLNFTYSSFGITLSRVGAGDSKVYANTDRPSGFGSAPNVVSVYAPPTASDFSESGEGRIRVTFSSYASSACIEFRPSDRDDIGVIRAYDSASHLLAEKRSTAGVAGSICVNAFRIHHVEFAGLGTHYGYFDNLSVIYLGGPMTGPYYLPAAANQPGSAGTIWRTDLEIVNRGTYASNYKIEMLKWNQANTSPDSRSYTLSPGHAIRYTNVISSVFGVSGAATLRVTGVGGSIVANARTYNNSPIGSYGQYIGAQLLDDGVQPGQTQHLFHLSQSTSDSTGFRTNLGLVSACPSEIVVTAKFYGTTGALLGTKTYTLEPFESIQVAKVLLSVVPGGVTDAYIALSSASPAALFFGYASLVDNRSGDGIHIPAQ